MTDWPLAVCDGSTFPFEDLVETDTVRQDYIGSNMFAQHRDHHDWYYLHHHRADEAMFFKQFDSESGVKARCKLLCFCFCFCFCFWVLILFLLSRGGKVLTRGVGCGLVCPHASFKHGLIDPSLPVRESIEVRALVFTNAVEGE